MIDEPTEDVDAAGDVDVDGLRVDRVIKIGRRGGNADKTAVERCWFEVLRHVLRTVMSASESGIYSTLNVTNNEHESKGITLHTSTPASNSA